MPWGKAGGCIGFPIDWIIDKLFPIVGPLLLPPTYSYTSILLYITRTVSFIMPPEFKITLYSFEKKIIKSSCLFYKVFHVFKSCRRHFLK